MTEIEKLVASGKGWTGDARRKYLDELHEGPELPLFCDDTDEMDPRMMEALAALKYDGELPEDLGGAVQGRREQELQDCGGAAAEVVLP